MQSVGAVMLAPAETGHLRATMLAKFSLFFQFSKYFANSSMSASGPGYRFQQGRPLQSCRAAAEQAVPHALLSAGVFVPRQDSGVYLPAFRLTAFSSSRAMRGQQRVVRGAGRPGSAVSNSTASVGASASRAFMISSSASGRRLIFGHGMSPF